LPRLTLFILAGSVLRSGVGCAWAEKAIEQAHYLVTDGPQWERVAPPKLAPGQSESIALAFNREFIFLGTRPQGLFRYSRSRNE
jgi:hypothetical protein